MSQDPIRCWEHTFLELGKIVPTAIAIAKTRNVWKAFILIPEITELVREAKCGLPDLNALAKEDAMIITSAAYDCIKKIISAI